MKKFTKHILFLALALAMSLGAWAQTHTVTWDGDALRSVNVSSNEAVKTQTIGGITVTANAGYFQYFPGDGMIAAPYALSDNGLVFSSTVNILSVEVNTTSTNSTFASSSGAETSHTYTVSPASTQFVLDDPDQWFGITSIVFTLDGVPAPDPYVPALDELTGNWNFLMPGSNKVVKAVLYDSIVLGPHVELYDAAPAFAAGDIYHRGDSTIYYYDTNNHHSFHLRADEQADGKYFGFWSDLDPTDPQYNDRTNRYVSPGYLTCGQRYTAAYPNNYSLTLLREGYGTLKLDGVGVDTVYTITFEQSGISGDNRSFTIPASRFPYDTTFSYNANIVDADAYDQMHEGVSISNRGDNWVTVRISGPFKYGGYYECELEGGASDDWSISCTATGTQPKMPYGITKTGDNTYSVMEGLTVNVTATPEEGFHLAQWSDQTEPVEGDARLGGSHSYTMPATDATLTATFVQNPMLFLTSNDGGTLELDGVTPGATTYNIIISENPYPDVTYTNVSFPFQTTVFIHEGLESVEAVDQTPLIAVKNGDNADITINGPYGGTIEYSYNNHEGAGHKAIFCTAVQGAPIMPEGVTYADYDTYLVLPGTQLSVTATPDSAHYLARIDGHDTVSNAACGYSFVMPSNDYPLMADFMAKPTLTLAHNDGGTLEAIVPQGGVTAMHLTTDQIPTWSGNTEYAMAADLQQFGFVAVDSAAAAAWTGAPASGFITLVYALAGNQFKTIVFQDGQWFAATTFDFYKADFYTSPDVFYFTTGASKSNVIASSTPNTYYIDYGTPVTVKATPDAEHYLVSFSDDAPAPERNSNLAVEKTYDSVIAPINLTANFQAKPTLTLTANAGGTLTLDGVTPDATTYNITIEGGNTYTNVTFPFQTTVFLHEGLYDVSAGGQDPLSVDKDGNNAVITISEPYGGGRTISYTYIDDNENFIVSHKNISCQSVESAPIMPAGVVSANATLDTFVVDYGTDLTVTATPEVHYHLEGWSNNVTDNGDSTATLTLTQNETVSATFAQNAPELAWEYDNVILANGDTISGYHGFERDTIAKLIFSSNDEFFDAYMNALQNTGTSLLRFGSSNTNVVSFADAFDPQSLSVNAPGTATVYMVHDGSVMAYDSAYFTAVILAPDTLTLVHNEGGEMTVETLTDSIRAIVADTTYAVVPGANVTVKATPDSVHYLADFDGTDVRNSNIAVNNTFTVTADTTLTANFEFKPTLTLVHNDGGEMEVMSAGGVTAIVPPTDKLSGWESNYEDAITEDDIPAALGFVAVDQAAAEAWTGVPASGDAMLIYGIDGETFYCLKFHDGSLSENSTFHFYPGGFYSMASVGILYITTGVTPSNVIASTEPNTYYIDYNTSVTVKATPSDTTYLVRFDNDADANSNVAVEKTYGPLTANVTATATFHAKPTLTLAQNENWGKVMLEGAGSGSSNGYTIKFSANGNTIVKENVTLPKTYQCEYGSPSEFDNIIRELYGWDGGHGNENAIPTVTGTDAITPGTESSGNYPKFTINSAFQGTATVTIGYTYSILVSDNWPIEISFVPALPAGVAQLDSVTYRVDYGTEVTVNAEATALHHVAGWQDEADNAYPAAAITYDNYAITEPANLFPALSTLTLTVTADTTTEVLFGINSYDVAATAQLDSREEIGTGLAMGRIAAVYADIDGNPQFAGPDDTLTYTAQGGSSSILIADTNYGYLFAGWYDANADTLMSDLPALNLTEAYEVEARFVPDTFEVSYTQNIATAGTIEGADRYPYLTNMTLVATPATGYHFVNWTNEEGDILGTAAELPIQVLRDSAITAILDTNVYDVVANVNIEGLGTVTGAGEVKHFLSTTLVATANVKYHFVKWINAAGDSVSANTTIEVFPVGDTTLTAVFDTNIYATVWSGESDTTYTSLPYTGLTATYTDFWGNEHTPVLTFVCGSQTVVTPNYPVTAGTWTVTATPEVGDSLTSPVTTLTINRAIVNITGATVETAKFYDENTDAVVTNAGTLNNVQGSDAVTHTTTASYSDAAVGDGKTITVNYTLHGTSALLANYTLTPASEVYTTNGDIIEPMEPRPDEEFEESDTTEVDNGFEVYAYGYCTGTSYRINYQLRYGYPDQYKLDFTDSRFTDVDWTNLPTAGRNGHIDIDMPVDLPTGDYTVTVTFRDSRYTWLESTPLTVTFHVNLPETYTRPLFKNVIALVDTCHCFTDIQWYYRADATQEWAAIPGATGYYYHANADQLDGQFFVKAKMNGVETFTCPQTDVETLITDEDGDISMDVFPNPTTDRVTVTVNGSQQTTHTLRILNTLGVELENGTFEGDITTIDFSRYQRGSYMVSVDGTVVRVIRN